MGDLMSDGSSLGGGKGFSWGGLVAALLIGLAGSLFLWVATPLNNFLLGNSYIADDFLPSGALFVVLVLVLLINPVLRALSQRVALRRWQLGVIFSMVLVACITPSTGLLRIMPYSLARSAVRVKADKKLADAYAAMDTRPSLFPDEMTHDEDKPVSEPFLGKLQPEEPIPWNAWLGPLFSWGGFVVPWMLMMVALAVIVLPQWRDNERLQFPLLTIERALIETPEDGRLVPPIFRRTSFWWAAGIVFLLHGLTGLNTYFPGRVPVIPLSYNLSSCFTGEPLRHVPWAVKHNQIHFIYLGVAFFMPSRIGFSIWFFQIAYSVMAVVGNAYAPPFHWWRVSVDHANGAFITLPMFVIWLGRRHWLKVIRSMFGGTNSAEDWRDRLAGYAFVAGCAGMFGWLIWVKVLPFWALALVVFSVLFALAITRVVAETGLPMISADPGHTWNLLQMLPLSWRSAASMYFAGFVGFMNSFCYRVCGMTLVLHGLAMDRKASPKKHISLAGLFMIIIVASVVISGAVHLWGAYRHDTQLDGRGGISAWGSYVFAWCPEGQLRMWQDEKPGDHEGRLARIGFGAGLALLLQWLCMVSPSWPLHPAPLLFVLQWYAYTVWFSVFLGWVVKVLILRYGGSRLYARAKSFFIGLIMGEIFAVVFWVGVTAILAALGKDYKVVRILPF